MFKCFSFPVNLRSFESELVNHVSFSETLCIMRNDIIGKKVI